MALCFKYLRPEECDFDSVEPSFRVEIQEMRPVDMDWGSIETVLGVRSMHAVQSSVSIRTGLGRMQGVPFQVDQHGCYSFNILQHLHGEKGSIRCQHMPCS